jgi:hypothetical protein
MPPKLRCRISAIDMAGNSLPGRRCVGLNGGDDFAANSQTAEIWRQRKIHQYELVYMPIQIQLPHSLAIQQNYAVNGTGKPPSVMPPLCLELHTKKLPGLLFGPGNMGKLVLPLVAKKSKKKIAIGCNSGTKTALA